MNDKVMVLIVENQLSIANMISSFLKKNNYNTIVCRTYQAAIDSLEQENIDLAMLDIDLEDGKADGIDVAKVIRQKYDMPFIFVTGIQNDYTKRRAAYTNPSAYITKPFQVNDIPPAIDLALDNYIKGKSGTRNQKTIEKRHEFKVKDAFFIKKKHTIHKVKIADIQYIKSDDNLLEIYTQNGKYALTKTLKSMYEILPENFLKVHQSYIINLKHITEISKIPPRVYIDKTAIPISQKNIPTLFKKIEFL